MFKNWEWSDTFLGFLAIVVLLCFGGVGIAIYAGFQDHRVQFYYMSDHGSGINRNGYCLDGYRQWYSNDTGVFCSDDVQRTITVMNELNAQLKATKR